MSRGLRVRIFCPLVDLKIKGKSGKKIERFVRRLEDDSLFYCSSYTAAEHKHVLERTATRGRLNCILRHSGIPYLQHEVVGETEALSKKRKLSLSREVNVTKCLAKKTTMRGSIGAPLMREATSRQPLRRAGAKSRSVTMPDMLVDAPAC